MIRRPPRSALFPYTTLFRSQLRPLGELGQPGALLTYVPEDVAVGRTDVRVAGLGEALVELIDEDLEGVVQQIGDVRWAPRLRRARVPIPDLPSGVGFFSNESFQYSLAPLDKVVRISYCLVIGSYDLMIPPRFRVGHFGA